MNNSYIYKTEMKGQSYLSYNIFFSKLRVGILKINCFPKPQKCFLLFNPNNIIRTSLALQGLLNLATNHHEII